jgi:hypothetical protein
MMTPYNRASRIVPIDTIGQQFVVSLADDTWRLVLSVSPSAQRADQVAVIGRQIVAKAIALAQADAYCHVAAEVDDRFLSGRLWSPVQVSMLCRELAELHTK